MDRRTFQMTRLDVGTVVPRRAQIWDICFDTQGDMWLTSSTDLYRIGLKSGITKKYVFKEISGSHANNYLNCIVRDSSGNLWFGSSGSGLFLYDPSNDTFRNFNTSDGLANDYITAMREAPQGQGLYIATNAGLSFLDFKKKSFENHGERIGFSVMGVNENGLYITSDGEIFVSGHRGLTSVMSNNLKPLPYDNQLYITGISVNNQTVRPGDSENILSQSLLFQKKIVLHPRHSILSISFTGTDFLNAKSMVIEYMLKGFDKRFIRSTEKHTATYTNLNPGKYTFIIRTPDGTKYHTASLAVEVLPPFYKSTWFFLLCFAFALSLVLLGMRAYAKWIRLRSSLEAEKREKKHIEEVNQSKFRFFTNISHEFRTPLTLIDAQLELLLMHNDMKPSIYSSILSVYKNSKRMRRLVDEVIDMRRQEQGFMKLKVHRQNIVDFIREIFLSFEDLAKQKSIEFNFFSNSETAEAMFDPDQMEKVICNLLSNAFKYTPERGKISLTITDQTDMIEIAISDTGPGISEQDLPFIFDRFYQVAETNEKLPIHGSGIGLSLAKGIVEMHGGTISTQSTPNQGACFTLTLPKELSATDPHIEVIKSSAEEQVIAHFNHNISLTNISESDQNKKPKQATILLVEDNKEVREILVRIFSPTYEILTAEDGKKGIELARKRMPDIILSDIMMPRMFGTEMCRILKSDYATCHIPVVLLTARRAEEHEIEGLMTGADDYITKPFEVKLLLARCNNLVSGRQRLQQKYRNEPTFTVDMLSSNPMDSELLHKATSVVESNLDNPDFDIQTFAREMGLSRTYLFSKIKGLSGMTPNEFIIDVRLKRSVSLLLANPQMSISEIAYRTGFNTLSYFIKCFKDRYSKSPNVYRKEYFA